MSLPASLERFISQYSSALVALLALLVILEFIGLIICLVRLGRLGRTYARLTRGTSGGNLEEVLLGYVDTVNTLQARVAELENHTSQLEMVQKTCLRKVGIVRYDAFEDIGGEQSFALSLIDSQNSGMVLSSVLGRNHVGVYAKALSNGKPSHPLTQEEIRALRESEALP